MTFFSFPVFYHFAKKNTENLRLINGHLGTVSGHFLTYFKLEFYRLKNAEKSNSSILIFQTVHLFSFVFRLLKTFVKCWNQTSICEFSTIVSFWPRQMTGEARGNFNEFVAVPPIFWIHQSLFYLWIMWKVRYLLKNSFNSLTLYYTT